MDKINEIIGKMTLTEKALMCSGRKFWFTRGIKKYGIKPYMVTDGPHGLRKQDQSAGQGINDSVKATCFPVAAVMANTWNDELIKGVGERIGDEALSEEVGVVLGPGANIKRSPLCGRNFEYYSEDPYLSGNMAASFIKGVQSKGVGTSLKHFAMNNQENDRLRINAVADERAIREIYLASFERAVKDAQPYTIMCSYNRINGLYSAENKRLLTDILRGEWGYKGYVMTDWGAINGRAAGIAAGVDLEMPGGSAEGVAEIVSAVEKGELAIDDLNTAVRRLLEISFKVASAKKKDYKYDLNEHYSYVRKVACEGAVLLKNDGILPLSVKETVTVIGSLFNKPRYQGNGSSLIKPNKLVSPLDAFKTMGIDYCYAEGYSDISDKPDEALFQAAEAAVRSAGGKVLFFMGLTRDYESEGFDRAHMRLPENQLLLLDRIAELSKDITIVLFGGAPVEMPWISKVKAVINMYLPGQAVGDAAADLIFGKVNPSGKLAESYPVSLKDNPSFNYFPEGPITSEYRESIYVGYRYYDTAGKEVLFPFGHGLSYTKFEYKDIAVDKSSVAMPGEVKVTCAVTNTGAVPGAEVIQLYVRKKDKQVFRPDKELKGYAKLFLAAGETGNAEFTLDERSFAYYNVRINDWAVESGEYEILIGASSRDIRLSSSIEVNGGNAAAPYDAAKVQDYLNPNGKFSDVAFTEILGHVPPSKEYAVLPVKMDTAVYEARNTAFGKLMYKFMLFGVRFVAKGKDENAEQMRFFMRELMIRNTMRALAHSNGGALTTRMADGLIEMMNGRFFRGLKSLLRANRANRKLDKELLAIEDSEYKGK